MFSHVAVSHTITKGFIIMCGYKLLTCGLLFGFPFLPSAADAAIILDYDVNIVQAGPVPVGSTIDWEIFVTVSGTPDSGANFGIVGAVVDPVDSFGETLSPRTIGPSFAGHEFKNGRTLNPPELQSIGALQLFQGPSTVDLSPSSFLLATGSYTLTQEGPQTLLALMNQFDDSLYYTAPVQPSFQGSMYDQVNFGSDTFLVNAIPEPSGLALLVVVVCSICVILGRRR